MKTKVVIIGGGVVGASCLYHLASKGLTDVVLLEKDAYGNASTGKSAGIIETQYTDKDAIELRVKSMPLFRKFKEEEGLNLDEIGYLRIGRQADDFNSFQFSVDLQTELGAKGEVLTPEQIAALIPDLKIEGIECGLFGPEDAYIDPYHLTSIYVEKAKEFGAKAHQNVEVTDIKIEDGKVHSVVTTNGTYECDYVINAAGAWASKIGEKVGVHFPVKGYRRQIVVLDAPEIKYTVPSVMDYVPGKEEAGLYFREERGGKIFAGLHWETHGEGEDAVDPDNYKQKIDDDYLEKIADLMVEKVPGFSNLGYQNGWAGLYPITPDSNPIVGELKEVKGFINCIGFGGFGVQVSPVFGQAISELIIDGRSEVIDLDKYSLYRFEKNELREAN